MKLKKVISVALASVLMVSLAACGNDSNSNTASDTESSTSSSKDSVTIAVLSDPTTLAPNGQSGDGYTYAQLYDQLWNLTDGELVMRVGTGYEQEDDTHYVITIQSGIKDTAGNEITASDVLFSLELAKNGTAGYPGAVRYIDIENCEVIDDTTLRVALTEPCSFQMDSLSLVNLVTQKSYEASPDGMVTTPVGSGPYVLNEYVTGSYITMDYNPDYWDGGDPEIKHITVNFVGEDSQRANVVLTGEVDFSYIIGYTDAPALEEAEGIVLDNEPSLNSTVLFFNNSSKSEFGGNLELRKAVAYAINNDAVIQVAAGGYAAETKSGTSSKFADYSEDFAEISADTDYYAYNVEKAKEAFEKSGVPEGTTLTLITGATGGQAAAAQTIQSNLKEIGLNVEIVKYPDTQNDVIANQPENWDMSISSWTNYPAQSTLAMLNTFFSSDYFHLEGEEKEVIMGAISKAMKASEEDVPEAMDELMTIMYEQLPYYGLFDECRTNAYNDQLNVVWKCQDYPLINQWSWK